MNLLRAFAIAVTVAFALGVSLPASAAPAPTKTPKSTAKMYKWTDKQGMVTEVLLTSAPVTLGGQSGQMLTIRHDSFDRGGHFVHRKIFPGSQAT